MITLGDIRKYLDEQFQVTQAADYPHAVNGLQLENEGFVSCLGAAVDASESTIEKAMDLGVDFLLVHHGLFWSGLRPVTGALYRKLNKAISGNMAIYSLHLPLDNYGQYGNSFRLGQLLELQDIKPCFESMGMHLGIEGEWPGTASLLKEKLEYILKANVFTSFHGPDDPVGRIAVLSGGSGGEIEKIHDLGIRTLVAGEGSHWTVPMAEEMKMNLIYAGHYATETFGVSSLAADLAVQFKLPWHFIDNPTGL